MVPEGGASVGSIQGVAGATHGGGGGSQSGSCFIISSDLSKGRLRQPNLSNELTSHLNLDVVKGPRNWRQPNTANSTSENGVLERRYGCCGLNTEIIDSAVLSLEDNADKENRGRLIATRICTNSLTPEEWTPGA